MTFTKDDIERGKVLHAEWNQAKETTYEETLAYRMKKHGVCIFWLRHGEAALDALEEAWEHLDILHQRWNQLKERYPALAFEIAFHGIIEEALIEEDENEEVGGLRSG